MLTTRRYRRRRRPTYRRKRRTTRRALIPRPIKRFNGLPQRFRTKLHYVDMLTANIAAGAGQSWTYQSSLFDPYYAVGGHQPYMFDQIALLYGYYRVYAMKVVCVGQSTTANASLVLVNYFNNDLNVAASAGAATERPFGRHSAFGAGYKTAITNYATVAKLMNVPSKVVSSDDRYAAPVTANPVQVVFNFIQAYNVGAAAVDVQLEYKITYYCEFFRMLSQSQS